MIPSLTQILHINRSGMLTFLSDLDVVSNNLANVNTVGYKSSRANFQEMLENARSAELAERRSLGVQIRATQRLMEQGSLQSAPNALDLAVNGEGFFAVELPDGSIAYTRDGQFKLDADLNIVSAQGYPLVWDGQVPQNAAGIQVTQNGAVMVLQGTNWVQAGTIELYRFANPGALSGNGQNLWLENDVSGQAQAGAANADGNGQILSYFLESSNVNLADEMTRLVSLQRSFEMSLRSFQQTDTMIQQAIHMRR